MDTIFTNDQLSMIVQNIPKYMYIKLALVNRIKTGELSVGAKLPSEKELCDAYACSRLTVRKALDVLRSEGYIRKVQGLGTFVSERNPNKQDLSTITSCSLPSAPVSMIAICGLPEMISVMVPCAS